MNIIGIGDNHDHNELLPKADVLIHTGDFSFLPREVDYVFALQEFSRFAEWMNDQDFKYKIYVPGNHDQFVQKHLSLAKEMLDAHILIDEAIEIENLKFYGTPWTIHFCSWYWTKEYAQLEYIYDQIPQDTDILITHGPPHSILDQPLPKSKENLGCKHLYNKVLKLKNLKAHFFGHIHGSSGTVVKDGVSFFNCSIMNERYFPINSYQNFNC